MVAKIVLIGDGRHLLHQFFKRIAQIPTLVSILVAKFHYFPEGYFGDFVRIWERNAQTEHRHNSVRTCLPGGWICMREVFPNSVVLLKVSDYGRSDFLANHR